MGIGVESETSEDQLLDIHVGKHGRVYSFKSVVRRLIGSKDTSARVV